MLKNMGNTFIHELKIFQIENITYCITSFYKIIYEANFHKKSNYEKASISSKQENSIHLQIVKKSN